MTLQILFHPYRNTYLAGRFLLVNSCKYLCITFYSYRYIVFDILSLQLCLCTRSLYLNASIKRNIK